MGDRDDSPGPLRYRLWAGGLFKDVTEEEVRKKMERFGEVIDVRIRSSARDTFAFIQFANQKAVDAAIEKMDNSTSLGDRVRVALATENTKKRGDEDGPRGGGGRRDDSRGNPRGGMRRDGRRADSRDDRRGSRRDDGRGDYRGYRDDYRDDRRAGFRGGRGDGDQRGEARYNSYDRAGGRYGGRRDDSRDCQRGGQRCDRRGPRDDYSPPQRTSGRYDSGGRDGRQGGRSRSRDGVVRMAGKVPVGRHKITIENLPEDMSWLELKDLGRDYGPSLTFARTYRQGGGYFGMLEFKDRADADRVISELNNRRVQGSKERLHAHYGAGPGSE